MRGEREPKGFECYEGPTSSLGKMVMAEGGSEEVAVGMVEGMEEVMMITVAVGEEGLAAVALEGGGGEGTIMTVITGIMGTVAGEAVDSGVGTVAGVVMVMVSGEAGAEEAAEEATEEATAVMYRSRLRCQARKRLPKRPPLLLRLPHRRQPRRRHHHRNLPPLSRYQP